MKRSETCSACKLRPIRGENQRYCKDCHNEAERKRRAALKPFLAQAMAYQRSTRNNSTRNSGMTLVTAKLPI